MGHQKRDTVEIVSMLLKQKPHLWLARIVYIIAAKYDYLHFREMRIAFS